MVIRYLAALAVLLFLQGAARAQEQSFAAFAAELWPDAQAKGISRATFDTALKGVTPTAPVSFAAAGGLLILRALLAAYVPSRRASRLSPIETLRCE